VVGQRLHRVGRAGHRLVLSGKGRAGVVEHRVPPKACAVRRGKAAAR
jgi:hypothetical protein